MSISNRSSLLFPAVFSMEKNIGERSTISVFSGKLVYVANGDRNGLVS